MNGGEITCILICAAFIAGIMYTLGWNSGINEAREMAIEAKVGEYYLPQEALDGADKEKKFRFINPNR